MSDSISYEGVLLTTFHGRDRRNLRGIDKRDLQTVKKFGKKERTYGYQRQPRWKFTYGFIVLITEDDEITEVTSWVIPVELPMVAVQDIDIINHNRLTRKMNESPWVCTSHFVIVVDQSASMRKCDVQNFKTRSDAVFGTIVLDYIGKQLDNRPISNAQYTDAITLIEMNSHASVVFKREPCTNVLYNKFIQRKETVRPRGHGMFKSALEAVELAFNPDIRGSTCSLVLMFLSDGKPSDYLTDPSYNAGQHMKELCVKFRERLTVETMGFAKVGTDFSVLQSMAECANAAGSHGHFTAVNLAGNHLSSVMQTISNTMTESRQASSLVTSFGRKVRTLRSVDNDLDSYKSGQDEVNGTDWIIYDEGFNKLEWVMLPGYHRMHKSRKSLRYAGFGDGVAIHKKKLGVGAERLVYRLCELSIKNGRICKKGGLLVAKECKYVEDLARSDFHEVFCKTQGLASRIALKFNERVGERCRLSRIPVPATITFLSCAVYEVPEINETDQFRYILVEKRLDPSKYVKWNSNNGHVRGHLSMVDVLNMKRIRLNETARPVVSLNRIIEGSDEEDSGDDSEEEAVVNRVGRYNIKIDDFPQAFSHFSYRLTKREKLVCDLQGVLDDSVTPAVYELTDPVIHYRSASNRKNVFGRTDRGKKGMLAFMQTHVCNDLCKMLGLFNYH